MMTQHNIIREKRRITLPDTFNYIGAFLTFACPYACNYCINRYKLERPEASGTISALDWLLFFERFDTKNIPVTLQGGEPGCHPDFIMLVDALLDMHQVDILSNLTFDLKKFASRINPSRINREAPYAPIRASYHPSQFPLSVIVEKLLFLMKEGFRVGLYAVTHPDNDVAIAHAQTVCDDLGIDFRTKPFLGWHNGVLHGTYAYPDACTGSQSLSCECASSELLIAPDGWIYPCHHHLYNQVAPTGHIAHSSVKISDHYHPCDAYGRCNPCDIKVKNNRFQRFGHTSMKIRLLEQQILAS
jgi:MoaA/NifB/PqqE/SkfB family radical SAM enzyme